MRAWIIATHRRDEPRREETEFRLLFVLLLSRGIERRTDDASPLEVVRNDVGPFRKRDCIRECDFQNPCPRGDGLWRLGNAFGGLELLVVFFALFVVCVATAM